MSHISFCEIPQYPFSQEKDVLVLRSFLSADQVVTDICDKLLIEQPHNAPLFKPQIAEWYRHECRTDATFGRSNHGYHRIEPDDFGVLRQLDTGRARPLHLGFRVRFMHDDRELADNGLFPDRLAASGIAIWAIATYTITEEKAHEVRLQLEARRGSV